MQSNISVIKSIKTVSSISPENEKAAIDFVAANLLVAQPADVSLDAIEQMFRCLTEELILQHNETLSSIMLADAVPPPEHPRPFKKLDEIRDLLRCDNLPVVGVASHEKDGPILIAVFPAGDWPASGCLYMPRRGTASLHLRDPSATHSAEMMDSTALFMLAPAILKTDPKRNDKLLHVVFRLRPEWAAYMRQSAQRTDAAACGAAADAAAVGDHMLAGHSAAAAHASGAARVLITSRGGTPPPSQSPSDDDDENEDAASSIETETTGTRASSAVVPNAPTDIVAPTAVAMSVPLLPLPAPPEREFPHQPTEEFLEPMNSDVALSFARMRSDDHGLMSSDKLEGLFAERAPAPLIPCGFCKQSRTPENGIHVERVCECGAAACVPCLNREARAHFEAGLFLRGCPASCGKTPPFADYQHLLSDDVRNMGFVLQNRAARDSQGFINCFVPGCDGALRGGSTIPGSESNDHFVCPVDHSHQRCLRCNKPWHSGLTCEGQPTGGQEVVRCPRCFAVVGDDPVNNFVPCKCGQLICLICHKVLGFTTTSAIGHFTNDARSSCYGKAMKESSL